ncbi:MAG: hypothetical protein ABIV48_13830 [Pyrinomonadaceae bacterium]
MKINSLMSTYAVVAFIYCLGLGLFPSVWITLYGAAVDPQASFLMRLVGALFGGIAVTCWKARNAVPSASRDAIVIGLATLNGLAAMVAIFGAITGIYNEFAWGPVVTFTLFTVAFASSALAATRSRCPELC